MNEMRKLQRNQKRNKKPIKRRKETENEENKSTTMEQKPVAQRQEMVIGTLALL